MDFKCVPERIVYNSEEFKIYGCSINSFEFPNIKINKYNNVTIKGNISELNLGVDYIVKAKEVSDSHGIGYEVINIKREKPTTLAATRSFLYEILTPNQTDILLEAYPDIVDRIMNNNLDDIDLNKTKGIKEYTFGVIKNKVIENFKLADIVEEFKGLFSLSIIKKLYDKYTSVDKIKEVIREEPYECLCRLGGIGFKTADSLLLKLDKDSKECKKNGTKPILFFGFDLVTSYQRAKACIDFLLDENENNGNTYINIGELKKKFDVLVPEAKNNLPLILKGDNNIIFDRELLSVCKKSTYETEKYIADRIKEATLINTKWDCDYTKFQSLDDFKLTAEQCKTSEYMCGNNIALLVGYGGCVDCDTEFFNGVEWKKISKYKNTDKVLQYNDDGTATLIIPEKYLKFQCDTLWHFKTKYGLDQCLSDEHECYYITSKGNMNHKKFLKIREEQQNGTGFKGKFITSFDYGGDGINYTDDEIRLLVAVFADGSFYKNAKEKDGSYMRVKFHLKKDRKKKRLIDILQRLNYEYKIVKSANKGYDDIYFDSILRSKHYPKSWYNCTKHQFKIISDEVMYWDGCSEEHNCYSTTNKSDADFIQFVYSSLGYRATINTNNKRKLNDYLANGKLYKRWSVEYSVCYTKRNKVGMCFDKRKPESKTQIKEYKTRDGYKYCFTVPSHMLVLRRNNKIFITGNSGKSSSTRAFINMLDKYDKSYLLLAPTGRAAKVLSVFTGKNAMTIHRGLGYLPPFEWGYNEENKLPYDVVIVDEFSMVDIFLFRHLLEAIDFNKTKLLLIGDDAQIPSVGAGNVLYDLLKYEKIPIVTLDKVFRYGKGGLSTVATDTRTSTEYLDKTKSGMQIFGEDQSYIFMPLQQEKLVDYTVQLYKTLLAKGYRVEDIAVLSCYNVGDYGTVALNKKIQEAVNSDPEAKIAFGDMEFRLNDIVMNYVNDYKAILYNEEFIDEDNTTFIANGESGRVVKILKDAMVVDYDGTLIYVPKASMKNIKLAYVISIHKSQGGQFKIVILVTPKAHTFMLNSNLLYVGESRAKEKCYHLGEIKTVNNALKKKENFDRKTMLSIFLNSQ